MFKTKFLNDIPDMDTTQLFKLKLKAKRAGVWFKTLPRIDRVLVDLAIIVTSQIRSRVLTRNLLSIVRKLEIVLKSSNRQALTASGLETAQRISAIAQNWGNNTAKNWAHNTSFAFFLAVMCINKPKTFKT
jgi:hypothetical protein